MRPFILFLSTMLILSACASVGELTLPTALDVKLERELKAKVKAEERSKQEEAEKKQELEKQKNAVKKRSLPEILSSSTYDPPELAFFELPSRFFKIKMTREFKQNVNRTMKVNISDNAVVWSSHDSDVRIIAWKNLADKNRILAKSKTDLINEFKQLGAQFDQFFQETRKSRASYKVLEGDDQIVVIVKSQYLEEDDWYNQMRCIFLYQPSYMMEIIVFGKEEDYLRTREDIDKAIVVFQSRLREFFPEGFKTQKKEAATGIQNG